MMSNCSKKDNDQNKERGGCHTLFLFISYYFLLQCIVRAGRGLSQAHKARGPARPGAWLLARSLIDPFKKLGQIQSCFSFFCQFFLFDYLYQAGPVHFQKSLARPEPQIPGPRPALAIVLCFCTVYLSSSIW